MSRISQDKVGVCGLLDAFEQAAMKRRTMAVELREGAGFVDEVVDVVTEKGQDFAVFKTHARVALGDIAAAEQVGPTPAR